MRTIAMLLVAVCLASTGCEIVPDGTACTALYAYGVTAEVTDATTGEFISDATLTLRDGNYEEEMQYRYQGSYVGAGERAARTRWRRSCRDTSRRRLITSWSRRTSATSSAWR